ncbi:MAG: hypothetical protein NTV34_04880 [Proteobacteria bacterium]|nr:hypothetical protein [Pseudomonadota bacterium]
MKNKFLSNPKIQIPVFLSLGLIALCVSSSCGRNSRSMEARSNLDLMEIMPKEFLVAAMPVEPISSALVHEDFRFVEYMLRKLYSGFEVQESLGMNWQQYFLSSYKEIDARPSWSASDFGFMLADLPKNMIVDGHIEVAGVNSLSPIGFAAFSQGTAQRWHPYIIDGDCKNALEMNSSGRFRFQNAICPRMSAKF